MKQGTGRIFGTLVVLGMIAITGCGDDSAPGPTPEPEVFNFRYLSVLVTSPLEQKNVTEITFNADDLKAYSYAQYQNGSRRINCVSNTFLDADDEFLSQDANSITFRTDEDAVFDVVDLNGNIARFSPAITGATSTIIHNAGTALTESERAAYLTEVTKRINRMPNLVFEIY